MKASYCNTLNNKETKSPGFSFNQEQIIQKKMAHKIFTETPFHLFNKWCYDSYMWRRYVSYMSEISVIKTIRTRMDNNEANWFHSMK